MGVNKVVFGAVSVIDISDSTVTPDTLADGVVAYGSDGDQIVGTLQPGIDTSDATAAAADILAGKTAYVNGQKITGTHECAALNITSDGDGNVTIMASGSAAITSDGNGNAAIEGGVS